MQTRIVTVCGKVSEKVYTVIEEDKQKNLVVLQGENEQFKTHRSRLIPVDSAGKAVAICQSDTLKGICPACQSQHDVVDNKIECDCSGSTITYVIVTNGKVPQPVRKPTTRPKTPKPKEVKMADSPTTTADAPTPTPKPTTKPTPAKTKPTEINVGVVKEHGELWVKDKVSFDHATIDVKSYALLQDNPPRKLCFNTYNGTLGKKAKDIDSLHLDSFSSNSTNDKDKPVGYNLRRTLEEERKRLERQGYEKV